jgi:tRNA-dihydrouridine synthase B
MRDAYGLDGAMIGRASIGNPWFFNQVKHYLRTGYKHRRAQEFQIRAEDGDKTFKDGN